MIIKLFDIENGVVVPTEHCYTLKALKDVILLLEHLFVSNAVTSVCWLFSIQIVKKRGKYDHDILNCSC
jgi:hypothetical protein